MVSAKELENYNLFYIKFETPKGFKYTISVDDDGEVWLWTQNDEFVTQLCEKTEIKYILEFEIEDIQVGNKIKIDDLECKIISFDLETKIEDLRFWDKVEEEELNRFD